ncbi:MAG: hypothetical protein ACRD3W_22440 [Terriglobales bacterium]
MHGKDVAVESIRVIHEYEDGWHTFTSPDVPGFYLVVEAADLATAVADIPNAIAELIYANRGERVSVHPKEGGARSRTHRPAIITHYSVERLAA